jgi:pilus assembly protein Flp/PilA
MVTVVSAPQRPEFCSHVQMELLMAKLIARFVKDESGATAIEYGLIASGIALAVIAAVNGTGTKLTGTFDKITSSLTN